MSRNNSFQRGKRVKKNGKFSQVFQSNKEKHVTPSITHFLLSLLVIKWKIKQKNRHTCSQKPSILYYDANQQHFIITFWRKKKVKKIEEATQLNPFYTLIDIFIFLKQTFILDDEYDDEGIQANRGKQTNKHIYCCRCRYAELLSFFFVPFIESRTYENVQTLINHAIDGKKSQYYYFFHLMVCYPDPLYRFTCVCVRAYIHLSIWKCLAVTYSFPFLLYFNIFDSWLIWFFSFTRFRLTDTHTDTENKAQKKW